jgi:hypothetical protein
LVEWIDESALGTVELDADASSDAYSIQNTFKFDALNILSARGVDGLLGNAHLEA